MSEGYSVRKFKKKKIKILQNDKTIIYLLKVQLVKVQLLKFKAALDWLFFLR